MKKLLFSICAIVALFTVASAQQETFLKRDLVFHAGIGLGCHLGNGSGKITVPPLVIAGDYGILASFIKGKPAIGVGRYLAYAARRYYNYFILGARGVFHYQFVDKLDTYAGIATGYEHYAVSRGANDSMATINFSSFIGARYYFSDSFSAFAELGYGIALLELGVAFKF